MESIDVPHFRFLDLPPELRDEIYALALVPEFHEEESITWREYRLGILRVNKQINNEAQQVFRRDNVFCRIETPWTETEQHISVQGHVPLIAPRKRMSCNFPQHHLSIQIDAPQHHIHGFTSKIVILLDDLPTFTNIWFLSDLSHPQLNSHFRLTLELHNPYAASHADPMLPKSLQQRLLLPFGAVKNLPTVHIVGPHYPSVESALRETMAVPPPTPESCLAKATALKDAGNTLLQKGDYRGAIAQYEASFGAIFIRCQGRRRDIWAEAHFQTVLSEGVYKDQNGALVTMTLRVRLVANVCAAYLRLGEYGEAHFWGMRTIRMIRMAMGDDEGEGEGTGGFADEAVWTHMPAAAEVGKIYYRTGVAAREMGEKEEARRLLRVAEKYLPHDKQVKKDLATVALRIL
ncbi:MAG: hypothetical protein M1821_004864 [Bathelium mastoideum]|nr:MAG: hypothetical protein M1821_004864 [Bathelium mastoideum]